MKRVKAAVVGAGAAGLMAAAEIGHGALLLEGNAKPGKKLLATGNGRCNLTNINISSGHYHGDRLAQKLLQKYPAGKIMAEFERMGLLCRTDNEGRVYPYNLQAAAVLQALWQVCEQSGVAAEWEFTVEKIKKSGGGFIITCADGREVFAENCILAMGGSASPKHSCADNRYEVAKQLGHSVVKAVPSLVPIKTTAKSCKALKGMRCKARAALFDNGREIYAESGEVIFGDGQISGICVFNLSARLNECGGKAEIVLDLLEELKKPELLKYLKGLRSARPKMSAAELFSGVLNLRVGQELAKLCRLDRDRALATLTDAELEKAADLCKGWRFAVTGRGDFGSAQVTSGGVPLDELNLETMESRKCGGLYIVGEMLNVDGDCGGYNLHWAWATAMAAARAVKQN